MNTQIPEQPKTLSINTEEGLVPKVTYKPYAIHNQHLPALKEKSVPFDFDNPPINPVELSTRLQLTMKMYGGVGLAAVQCNIPLRVFALGCDITCFNPTIIEVSKEIVQEKEGCLSFPGLFIAVKRPASVKLQWQNEKGEWQLKEFTGLTARTILHEYDHLEGILFTSKVGGLTLQFAKKKQQKLLKKARKFQEAQERAKAQAEAANNKNKSTKVFSIPGGQTPPTLVINTENQNG